MSCAPGLILQGPQTLTLAGKLSIQSKRLADTWVCPHVGGCEALISSSPAGATEVEAKGLGRGVFPEGVKVGEGEPLSP